MVRPMVDDVRGRYPTPGSYAAELFGLDEEAFGDRETRRFDDLRSALQREGVGVP